MQKSGMPMSGLMIINSRTPLLMILKGSGWLDNSRMRVKRAACLDEQLQPCFTRCKRLRPPPESLSKAGRVVKQCYSCHQSNANIKPIPAIKRQTHARHQTYTGHKTSNSWPLSNSYQPSNIKLMSAIYLAPICCPSLARCLAPAHSLPPTLPILLQQYENHVFNTHQSF